MVLCPPFLWVGELGGFSSALLMEELKSEKKNLSEEEIRRYSSYHIIHTQKEREREIKRVGQVVVAGSG
jgi:hypothetical protein